MVDLLICGVKLLDLETGTEKVGDVSVKNGKIHAVSAHTGQGEARKVLQADGMYLFPGFIDIHTHLFAHGSTFGIDADKLLSAGTTCAVDMGSAGWINYPAFHQCDLENKQIRLFSYLNLSPVGQPGKGINEPLNDEIFNLGRMEELTQEYPGEIVGIKVRISRPIVRELGLTPLKKALTFGEHMGLPVCVHTTDPPERTGNIAKILRSGDIYSHTYHGKGNTILTSDGVVQSEVFQAQKRGVQMEVGNGRINFNFPIAEQAVSQGLWPNLISSDATPATFHQEAAMWDLPKVMSKFLQLGMPLKEVVRAVTETPAKQLGVDKSVGLIKPGYFADLVLCQVKEGVVDFRDSDGNIRYGNQEILPVITICDGEIRYRNEAVSSNGEIYLEKL